MSLVTLTDPVTPQLLLHIGAGSIGILAGAAALTVRKGARLHRVFGTVFVVAMLATAVSAGYLAFFIPRWSQVVGVNFVFYLLATGWMTVRRQDGRIGLFERGAPVVAIAVAIALVIFGAKAALSPRGTFDKVPAAVHFIIAAVALLAAAGDLRMILRGGISGAPRIARHLWRMCAAFFIATGSFFIGQQKVMPKVLHGSPLLYALAAAPLLLMIFWLIRVRFTNRFSRAELSRERP
jgi:uncharacterized membrane protein